MIVFLTMHDSLIGQRSRISSYTNEVSLSCNKRNTVHSCSFARIIRVQTQVVETKRDNWLYV